LRRLSSAIYPLEGFLV